MQTAESLCASVTRLRNVTFLVASFSTALLVSIAVAIGFIGLIPMSARPCRAAVCSSCRRCALLGAALLLGSDLAARPLLAPQELSVGVVTSSVGAFFITLLQHKR